MPYRPVSVSRFNTPRVAPRLADGPERVRRQPLGRVTFAALSPALFFLVLLAACSAVQAKSRRPDHRLDGVALRFGSWVVGCSNLRVCAAIAPVREFENGDQPAHVRLTFTADKAQPHAAAIVREDGPVEELSAEAAHRLARDLLDPQFDPATLVSTGGSRFAVPRDGFAGLTQALALWRAAPPQQMRPFDTVTPLPARPLRDAEVPPVVSRAGKLCPDNHSGVAPLAWQGAGGARLWQVHCANEGLNSVSFWFYSSTPGAAIEAIRFEDRDGPAQAFNSQFDAESGTLHMVHYFGGQYIYRHEDCGVYRSYGWTVKGLKLIEKRFMPVCGTRIDSEDWIVIYQATMLIGSGRRP